MFHFGKSRGGSCRAPLVVCCVFVVSLAAHSAWAQDNVVLDVTSFQVDAGAGPERYIRVGFRSNLPEDTSVTFKLNFESEPIPQLWMGCYLEPGGQATAEIGPLDRRLLPGVYEVILVVDPQEQNPDKAEFWSRYSRAFERVSPRRIGSEQEEKELRAQYRAPLHSQVVDVENAIEEIRKYEDELKRGTDGRFFPGGEFQLQEFTRWADGVVNVLSSLERFYLGIPTEYYVPYYAGAYKYLLPSVWTNARYALVDYTIYPIFERERKKAETRGKGFVVPERFHPLKGGTVRPPRETAFQVAARDLLNVRKMIGEAPALPPLASYVPGMADLPTGFVLGAIPEDLRYLLDQNPVEHSSVSGKEMDDLVRFLDGFEMPQGMDLPGLYYCLTPEPPRDGTSPDPATRVVVLVLRFPDEGMTAIPVMEFSRTDRKTPFTGRVISSGETVAIVLPGADDASKSAAEHVAGWLGTRHGFGEAEMKFSKGGGSTNGGGR